MIFVTVGLEQFPFDRLLKAVDRLVETQVVDGPVFGQTGHSNYAPQHFEYCRFMPFDEMQNCVQEADTVLCHCGVGTILLALKLGKVPLVFPRRAAFGEQLDDHQLDLAIRMKDSEHVFVAYTEEELSEKLFRYEELKNRLPARTASTEPDALVGFLNSTLRRFHGT